MLVGTHLWRARERLGLVERRVEEQGEVPVVIETPWMTREEMAVAHSLASQLSTP